MWDEPPFYRAFDAVLDNEGDAVFLVNGGDGELIRYDIGSGRTSRIGRRGAGPGEFGRPVWLEPHGPDSLLAYNMSLGRFSVFSRSGDFGRIFMLPGDGGRGRHVAAVTRMGARVWAALSLGTPPGTKARDTVAVLEVTPEGGVSNTVARVPHGLWTRLGTRLSSCISTSWTGRRWCLGARPGSLLVPVVRFARASRTRRRRLPRRDARVVRPP